MNFENMENNKDFLDENNVDFETMKSGGPGGQNVDKRSTAVRLRVLIDNIPVSEDYKKLIKDNLPPRHLTKNDELIIENSEGRSQDDNKDNALRIANEQIQKAIKKGKQKEKKEQHKKRARKRQKKSSGGGEKNIKEKQKQKYRSETTDDLLEQAIEEDPDLKDRLSND